MGTILRNGLFHASSAYLRSAMELPVHWLPWSPEAFAQAAAENKPILLDIGAVWCHWCHVMDRESYGNAETATLINEHFIAIKVDRDERPDVDARYQAAVSAISGLGGWPLTAFLTPDGRPYFGGTYFPPEERYGQPSFRRVLMTMAASFHERRGEVEESAGSVMEAIEYSETFAGDLSDLSQPSAALRVRDALVASTLAQYDPVHGGFGSQPKFPHPAALNLLLDVASEPGTHAAQAARDTLQKMARGGIFDQLAGGFHRYSVDERWVVPHFEKMAYDNAEVLRSYVHAVQTFDDRECREAALAILRWMDECLADQEHGGFYASQAADVAHGAEGDYFTWTREEAAAVLLEEEQKLAELYFDIGPVGDVKHDPARNVLFRPMPLKEAAARAGVAPERAAGLLTSAKAKLHAARLRRPAPIVDWAMYTAWNAMCISAYVEAGRVLQQPHAILFAQKSLDRTLQAVLHDGRVRHVIAYADPSAPNSAVSGVLDDYVFLAHACLDLWEAIGEASYYRAAQEIAATLLSRFYDAERGGFFDTETDQNALGALRSRRKPLQDAPTPAGNPAGAALLLRLHALLGEEVYRVRARETLECFAGVVEHLGLYAASFGLALGRLAGPAVQVIILAEGEAAAQLEAAALAVYQVNKSVLRLRRAQLTDLSLVLAETLPNLPDTEAPVALVCRGRTCQAPVFTAAALAAALQADATAA